MRERRWHRHWPEGIPKTIEYPKITLSGLLRRTAEKFPERVAIRFFNTSLTYREFDQAANRFASGLVKMGIQPGDRVALFLPNTPHHPIALFGTLRAGAIAVQTSPLYTPRELEVQLNDAGASTIVTMDLFWNTLVKTKPKTGIGKVVVCDVAEFLRPPLRWLYPIKKRRDLRKAGQWPLSIPRESGVYRFSEVMSGLPQKEDVPPKDDVVVLQYTGGTTGTPKGAMLTNGSTVSIATQVSTWFGPREGTDRIVVAVPLFHVYGLGVIMTAIALGAESILVPDPRDTKRLLDIIERDKPTIFPGVPTLFVSLLNNPRFQHIDTTSIKTSVSGGAPLPLEVRRKWEKLTGGMISEGLGITEASFGITSSPLVKNGKVREGVGIPLPDTDLKIVDSDTGTKELPPGEEGEIIAKGPQIMKGYWNKPEDTADVLREGWLYTGDIGKMDDDGYFYVVERKKDVIIASGFKIFPREVEEVLYAHPGILEAAVIGVPDAYRGETVKAFVVRKSGSSVTEDEIIDYCRERLAPYKIPRTVEFISELPKSMVGKILRKELRARERLRASSQ